MYPNPLVYCTCWDPWNLGPRKLIKTPRLPCKNSTGRSKLTPLLPAPKNHNYLQPTKPVVSPKMKIHSARQEENNKSFYEVINVSPGYQLVRNREQISVTLGDEMFDRKKRWESEIPDKGRFSRTNIISDLEEQISELTAIIEQMNRDHQSAQKLLSSEMDLRCAEMKQNFENKNRELKEAHEAELSELENNYKAALKAEKLAAQEKLEEMGKEYKYLKNMFRTYQDSIYDEMEEKWSKQKAKWKKDEKLERENILLQQKKKVTKKFELESREEEKKINESCSAVFENFIREKEELLKQHQSDTLQLEELRKTKEVMEEELHAQALILESLNTNLYYTQLELQKEKAIVGNLEKMLQTKFAEAEEKYKHTIQILTEENIHLKQKIISKNEEIYEGCSGRLASITVSKDDSDTVEDGSKKGQES
ncbi:flagellum-associated coiled-coil domain-containing protein 1 isoform X1 [Pongo pygmaeus]|uniref:flagellum-associated coiled-coil domain-containing protein 1 isoform X1 n=1 Tax=Pongo pygmaeus TaxID=9600 RepID=UPI0023E2D3D9|nr:flagellum-associated coiled-coil domain-containing protein 1 isoform X1 [Pongo pygmaeus]XP_054335075.1 flagellum-associated coiled-coil domain-containing protein 1 isoform X1 [Pongo pygmaeus]XP_054335077.1 flagellum-associated coiled-coil domain-containing protein 1 isoform X1 [Pongo pygmaeus]XP_054335078.1 flagellum-associated coiled-coil domain-containing protein 1 isoform X1 [Pongo pygmaeus]XP_054335079.1 flagellum-associated coiled-coil domain-containing protein 1 isoform X1 [Pongo pygma